MSLFRFSDVDTDGEEKLMFSRVNLAELVQLIVGVTLNKHLKK